MAFTAAQVREMLDRFEKEKPERWSAAVKTIVVDQAEAIDTLRAALQKVSQGAFLLAQELRAMRDGRSSSEAPAGEGTAAAPAVGADGQPLSPEEAAREAEMSAAIAAAEAEKRRASVQKTASRAAPKSPVSPGSSGPNARSRPAAGPPPAPTPAVPGVSVSPSASNGVTPDQAAIEAQMDQAIAAAEAEK